MLLGASEKQNGFGVAKRFQSGHTHRRVTLQGILSDCEVVRKGSEANWALGLSTGFSLSRLGRDT